jgi:hypothetical protein
MLLSGCAVGIVSVRPPDRLPAESLPALTERVSFDACIRISSPPPLTPIQARQLREQRMELADRIRRALSRAGVESELVAQAGSPAHFTVTEDEVRWEHDGTFILSMLTFSLLPGYLEEVHGLQVALSVRDPRGAGRVAPLKYEAVVRGFSWLPLIVHPDFIGSINGGWESAKAKNAGEVAFEGMIHRLADDLRNTLGRDGALSSWSDADGVVCLKQ